MAYGLSITVGSTTVQTEGHERDIKFSLDRNLRWMDTVGGTPKAFPILPSCAYDAVDFSCSVWLLQSAAASLQAAIGPGISRNRASMAFAGDSGFAAFPGFGNYSSGAWVLQGVTLAPLKSNGRKAPGMDLYGYELSGHFSANGYGTALNERGTTVPTLSSFPLPSWVAACFMAHQIQDPSEAPSPLPLSGGVSPYVQHGRRWDTAIQLDHVWAPEMDAAISWFRAQRSVPFTLSGRAPFGPSFGTSAQAVARGLEVREGAGVYWEGTLSVSLYQ
jgi:hypothetical protein